MESDYSKVWPAAELSNPDIGHVEDHVKSCSKDAEEQCLISPNAGDGCIDTTLATGDVTKDDSLGLPLPATATLVMSNAGDGTALVAGDATKDDSLSLPLPATATLVTPNAGNECMDATLVSGDITKDDGHDLPVATRPGPSLWNVHPNCEVSSENTQLEAVPPPVPPPYNPPVYNNQVSAIDLAAVSLEDEPKDNALLDIPDHCEQPDTLLAVGTPPTDPTAVTYAGAVRYGTIEDLTKAILDWQQKDRKGCSSMEGIILDKWVCTMSRVMVDESCTRKYYSGTLVKQ